MKSVGEPTTVHQTTSEFINDDDFSIFDDVVDIFFHDVVGTKRFVDMVIKFHVVRVSEVVDTEVFFAKLDAVVGQRYLPVFFFDLKVAVLFQ